jgi:hypothetical protein
MRKQIWLSDAAPDVVGVLSRARRCRANAIVPAQHVSANGASTGSNANAEKTPTTATIKAKRNGAGRSVIGIIGVSTASVIRNIVRVTANSNSDAINSSALSPAKRPLRVRKAAPRAGLQRGTRQSRILLFLQALIT